MCEPVGRGSAELQTTIGREPQYGTMYCNVIRDEEQQRNTIESELESFLKSTEDAYRKNADATKENWALKDKKIGEVY